MKQHFLLLLTLMILVGCQASGGGAPDGGIITGHTPADNKFTLTTTMNKTYFVTEVIDINLNFPKAVTVAGGTPSIDITLGSTVRTVPMSSGNGTTSLVFSYTVVNGDDDMDGIAVSTTLNKNGSTIKYDTTFDTTSTIVVPNLSTVLVNTISGTPPVAANITPPAFNEDTQSIMTLSYSDVDSDLATSCTLSSLVKVTVTQPCACAAGVCTVGVTGTAHANGAASFQYRVTANSQQSNLATASFTMNPVADTPFANNITPPAFSEDTQSIITLSYLDGDADPATACTISTPTNVTVTQPCACAAGVCTVGVTGTSNYSGAASFNYTVTANAQVSNSASATLSITAVGDAPVATNITPAAFNEDVQSIITLAYTDVESNLATACAISTPTNVTVTQACACNGAGVCTVGVTGTSNYNGAAGFGYTVTANAQTSNTAAASFTINAVDDAPVATNITPAAFNSNTQSVITLAYSDVESHLATVCSITTPTNVTVTQACACAAGTCTVGVTSTFNYSGAASFNYTVTANGLPSNSALASLTVNPGASSPVAANITPSAFNEDTEGTITLSYTDPNSDQATSCAVSGLSNVTVTTPCACAAGVCSVGVTGTANHNGAASFNYTVTANGDISNSASATLSITAVDDAPVALAITPPAFNENAQSIITLSYSDIDPDLATACTISGETNVTVTQACACAAGTCTVGVTGLLNYNGAASFNYTVTANSVVSNSVAATLTINAVDSAPVAAAINPPAFNEDIASTITLSYTDVESDQATTCTISALSNVTVSTACACAAGVCTVGVTGTANYNGSASFGYTVTANSQTSNTATATLSITSVDDIPVTSAMTPPAFNEDAQSIITLSYVDVDHQASSCTISALSNVTVTQACACAAGVCTVGVTGTTDYIGAASFDFTVTANSVVSNSSTATLSIIAVNDPPVATNITPVAFNEDIQSIITLAYTDPENDQATVCTISSPVNVSVTQACACAAGTCTVGVTGSSNYNGAASFGYTVTANSQTSNTATATLSITPVADAPVAINITPAAFNEDISSSITLSYSDAEGDLATSCAVAGLTNVTVTTACTCVVGTCTVGVRGTSNYNGIASFTYTVTAASQASNSATASLTISSVEDAAVATNTSATFNEDVQAIVTLTHTDVDSQSTTCSITSPTNVTVTQACACAAGVCTVGVTGAANYNGSASFAFTVSSNSLASNLATANLTITSVNDVPTISAIGTQSGNMNTTTSAIPFTLTDSDQTLSCSATHLSMTSSNNALVTNGSVTWGGSYPNCTAAIAPVNGAYGTSTITISVNDGAGGVANSAFTLNISGVLLVWTNAGGTQITSFNFGTPGANITQPVYVKNIGNMTSAAVVVTDAALSSKIAHTTGCGALAANASCLVTLEWTDNGPGGLRSETFTATANGSAPQLSVTGTK